MASGASIQAKVKAILQKLNATNRVVKLREVTETGGDPLLGLPGSVTTEDTVVSPQPGVFLVSAEEVGTSGGFYQLGDYKIVFDGSIPESTLRNRLILYGDEVLKVKQLTPFAIGGIVVAWEVTARSVKAGS